MQNLIELGGRKEITKLAINNIAVTKHENKQLKRLLFAIMVEKKIKREKYELE